MNEDKTSVYRAVLRQRGVSQEHSGARLKAAVCQVTVL